jgi:thioesterase domain-containing protein/acyl carrier protein
VGGESLGRGYLNREELTAERFISAQFSSGVAGRVFKTGDRARYLPDGNLAFEGRIDDQVKIRGIRVEPGEIEARLRQYPGVSQAAVVARKHGPSGHEDTRLAAFVVPEAGMRAELGVAGLRSYLRAKLPDYMLPAEFAFVDTLPLTSSGKVDRQSLPFPDAVPPERATTCVAPRDELEKRLAAVWERTFAVSPIGIRDDFFDLGGHSLLAVRLFAEIEKAIGVRLPVRVLFEAPTIEGLAALIRERRKVPTGSALVPLQTDGTRPPLFIVHAAGGYVLSFRALARYLGPDQPVYALQDPEADTPSASSASVPEMAARYIQDIRSVQPRGPYALGGLSFGGIIAWEMAQQLSGLGEEVPFLALLDTRGPEYRRPTWVANAVYHLRQRLEFHRGNLSRLDIRGKLRYVEERTRTLAGRVYRHLRRGMAGAVSAIRQPMPKHVRQAYRAAMRARQEYSPQRYSGHVALFRASRQPRGLYDPLLGWGGLVQGELKVIEVPGAHFTIITEPYIQALAEQLKEELGRAQDDDREG